MPRIRSLKPEHRLHRKVGPLSDRQYRLWIGMLCEADDEGRLVADAGQLRLMVFGYHPGVSPHDIAEAMSTLEGVGLIRLYRVGETLYAEFPSWHDHQRLDKPYRSTLPGSGHSTTIPRPFRERSKTIRLGSEGSKGRNRRKGSKASGGYSPNGPDPRAAVRAGIAGRHRMSADELEAEVDRRMRKRGRA